MAQKDKEKKDSAEASEGAEVENDEKRAAMLQRLEKARATRDANRAARARGEEVPTKPAKAKLDPEAKRAAMLERLEKARAVRQANRAALGLDAPKPPKPKLDPEAKRAAMLERLEKARAVRQANRAANPKPPKAKLDPEAKRAAMLERLEKARAVRSANRVAAKAAYAAANPPKKRGRPRKNSDHDMRILGIGIIGAGGIARGVHIPGYEALSNAQVLAVSDPIEAAREGVAQQFNIEDTYADFHEMLKRDDIDAVSVTTPNFLHAEATIAALEAGKHVLCEKPLAMNLQEAQAMVEASQRTGKKLMCGFNYRFAPEIQTLRHFAQAGEFGEMYYARTQALRRRGIPGWGMFISKEKNGGGPLIDIGVHMLDATMHVMGFPKPIAVSGKTWQMFGKRSDVMGLMGQWDYKNFTVEDFAVAQVRFDNGSVLTLESSFVANQEEADKMSFQIYGDAGGCQYNPLKMFREENKTLLDVTPVHLPRGVQSHHEEIKSFVNSILNDEPVFTPGEEALEITRIIDAIYESSETGKEVVF